jgi:hypothetical protein
MWPKNACSPESDAFRLTGHITGAGTLHGQSPSWQADPPFRGEASCHCVVQRCYVPAEIISGEAEHDSGIGLKLFGFISEPAFTFIPESCSRSPRNTVRKLGCGNRSQPPSLRFVSEPTHAGETSSNLRHLSSSNFQQVRTLPPPSPMDSGVPWAIKRLLDRFRVGDPDLHVAHRTQSTSSVFARDPPLRCINSSQRRAASLSRPRRACE